MNKRLSNLLIASFGLLLLIGTPGGVPGQTTGARQIVLTGRAQHRPVAWPPGSTLWFAPPAVWVDGFEGGVQSGTLDETVELQIWNTTRREIFGPGFIRFERAAGGVKEGVLAKDTVQCVVGTKKNLMFVGATATVEYGYDACVMKGTLVNQETLRLWDGSSETFPAGTEVEFNGAGDVIRGILGPGGSGAATGFDGEYSGTCTLTCYDNSLFLPAAPPAASMAADPGAWPTNAKWPEPPDAFVATKAVPFKFTAKGGLLQGGHDDPVYSLKWKANYDASGAISKGSMDGWVDLYHPSYAPLHMPDAWPPPRGSADPDRANPLLYLKLRWTITGPITGTLGPTAGGELWLNTSNDVVNNARPDRTDRLLIPQGGLRAGGIITCACAWTATKGRGTLDLTPTPEGKTLDLASGTKGALDLIFVIDQTSSMSDDIEQVKKTAKEILASIGAAFPDHRVAVVGYRDWGDPEVFKEFPFSSDAATVQAAIDSLTVSGGGDEPEAVFEALLKAIRLPWRNGVNKQIILMGDAPPHSPIPDGPDKGKTADHVVKAAFDVDPAMINTILVSRGGGAFSEEAKKAFEDLSTRSKGTFVTADKAEEVPKRMMEMVDIIRKASPESAPAGGGGGGGPVLPRAGVGTSTMVALGLAGACLALLIAIVAIRQRGGRAPAGPTTAGLRVEAGLTITFANGSTTSFRITGPRTTIGRAEDNVLVVDDAEMSAHHAEILASREGFRLRDAGSANGTTVNGQPVTDAYLNLGDEIGAGTTRLTLTE